MIDSILKICEQKLKYLNYSSRTNEIYLHYIRKFLETVGKYPQHLVSSDFQNYLNGYNFSSISQQNQIINAIKFLYEKALNKKYEKVDFQRPRKERHLPRVIDKYTLIEKINNVKNLKHKAILSIGFSVGLRVSEVCNLKIADIDSKRGYICIKNAKGKKDRFVPLSNNLLTVLREYYKAYHPVDYLFNGQFSKRYSEGSCEQIYHTHIDKNTGFHTLRHSAATSILADGGDLMSIQKLLGHNSVKTTMIYTHVTDSMLKKLPLAI